MKYEKGDAGYLSARKKKYGLQALAGFTIVAVILLTGIIKYHTRLNLFTVLAILGCLPASKLLVEFITMFPYKSVKPEVVRDLKEKAWLLTACFDMVITSREKVMPVDAIVISGQKVFGYASNSKTNTEEAAKHIRQTLAQNGYPKMTVKVFSEYVPFLSRAEGINSMLQINQDYDPDYEQQIKAVILTLSM